MLLLGKALIAGDYGADKIFGIFTYYIPQTDETLAFLYHVQEGKENIWNVQNFNGERKIDSTLITEMEENDPKRGDNTEHEGDLGDNFRFEGTMTYSRNPKKTPLWDPTLKIRVLHK